MMKESEIAALAKALVPFMREMIAEAVAPLEARIAQLERNNIELEDCVRSLVQAAARRHA
jgi:hypothetical protein